MEWTQEVRPVTTESRLAFRNSAGVRGYRNVRWTEFHQPETFGAVYAEDNRGVYYPDGSCTGDEPKIIILDESPTEV